MPFFCSESMEWRRWNPKISGSENTSGWNSLSQRPAIRVPKVTNLNPMVSRYSQNHCRLDTNGKHERDVVLPLKAHCLCCLKAQRDSQGHPTLGIFRRE